MRNGSGAGCARVFDCRSLPAMTALALSRLHEHDWSGPRPRSRATISMRSPTASPIPPAAQVVVTSPSNAADSGGRHRGPSRPVFAAAPPGYYPAGSGSAMPYAAAPAPVVHDAAYRLDAGDKLRVVVYGQEGPHQTPTRSMAGGAIHHAPDRLGAGARKKPPAGVGSRDHRQAAQRFLFANHRLRWRSTPTGRFFILGEVAATRPISLCAPT